MMNSFFGKIVSITSSELLSYVTVVHQEDHVGVMMIDTPQSNAMLKVGNLVRWGFKQTDVMITQTKAEGSSPCFAATVVAIEKGEALSSLKLEWKEETINAILPTTATSWVKEEEKVFVYLHPSHIFLLKGDHGE